MRRLEKHETPPQDTDSLGDEEQDSTPAEEGTPEEELVANAPVDKVEEDPQYTPAIMPPRRKARKLNDGMAEAAPPVAESPEPAPRDVDKDSKLGAAVQRSRRTVRRQPVSNEGTILEPATDNLVDEGEFTGSDAASAQQFKNLTCRFCKRVLKSLAALVQHRRVHERKNETPPSSSSLGGEGDASELEEEDEGDDEAQEEQASQSSIGVEVESGPLTCELCGAPFQRQSTLTRHRNSQHGNAVSGASKPARPQRNKRRQAPVV